MELRKVESLWGKIAPNSFGDRVTTEKPVRRPASVDEFESEDEEIGPVISWIDSVEQQEMNESERNFLTSIKEEAQLLRSKKDKGDKDLTVRWLSDQRQILDLEKLASDQSGLLFVANKRSLDEGVVYGGDGYSEIRIKSSGPKPLDSNEKLVKITDMPDWARPAFKGIQELNRVQSQVYQTALSKASNILLCAPPGSGKTIVALLTILRQLQLNLILGGTYNHGDSKIVYVAPMKALVAELVCYLSDCLQHYHVTVRELSGDKFPSWLEFKTAQIIVTTPENWDLFTRRYHSDSHHLVKVLIIDDIHLLHHTRGPVLETIVARTVMQIKPGAGIRLVGLLPTLQNSADVARFLQVDLKDGLFVFDCGYRPVQMCITIPKKKSIRRYLIMKDICFDKVLPAAGKHQVLVFVNSSEEAVGLARDTALENNTIDSKIQKFIQDEIGRVTSNDLKVLLPHGFAVLHGELTRDDRQIVEKLFQEKHLQVLISTKSEIWGLKLTAATVVIEGTPVYNPEKGTWMEQSCMEIMRMLGFGRRQFDHGSGSGIIITGDEKLMYHLSLMTDQLRLESQFISKLADQLNAEIVLGTVRNATMACDWLSHTYLYFRMQRNPKLYGLLLAGDKALEGRIADLIHSAATILDKNNMVIYDRKGGDFQVTELGRIASRYCIAHGTIATFNKHLKPKMGNVGIYHLLSLTEELKYVAVRPDESVELKLLASGIIKTGSAKIKVLLHAYDLQLQIERATLRSDMVYIAESVKLLAPALSEMSVALGCHQLADKARDLAVKVNKRRSK